MPGPGPQILVMKRVDHYWEPALDPKRQITQDLATGTGRGLRIALVHDWLTGMRGGEKCLEVACKRWPGASLHTLIHKKGALSPDIERMAIRTSWLQNVPGIFRNYRYFLPVMPLAARSWKIGSVDLVLSFSHCVAKAVQVPEGIPHISYCFTPMRYAWHQRDAYFGAKQRSWIQRSKDGVRDRLLNYLQRWDAQTSKGVTRFIAISNTISKRIKEAYNRDSEVIYPPVDTDYYTPAPVPREDFYLVISALAPYKKIDLAIQACRATGKKLYIIGSGQEENKLRQLGNSDIHFLGWQPDEVLRDYLRRCRALLFPGEEDFGIVPLEAQACGTPVIALGKGGATETIIPKGVKSHCTGVWIEEPTLDAMVAGIEEMEREYNQIDPLHCRNNALRFRLERFQQELFEAVNRERKVGMKKAA